MRCLGKGRPFYLEILDPKKTNFTPNDFRTLEQNINASGFIKVRDLQVVHRSELGKIKQGEESKKKEYNALCVCKNAITQEHIDKINNLNEITLWQKTPIRVLHRRPLAVRQRKIYKINAKKVAGACGRKFSAKIVLGLFADWENWFEFNVVTQAGTYVKEFVHGDFGRTKPSLGDLIGAEVDILALDVISIDLDWPKEVCYE